MYGSQNPFVEVATMTLLEETTGTDGGTIHVSNVGVGSEFWAVYAAQQHGIVQTVETLNASYLQVSLQVRVNLLVPSGQTISVVGTVQGPIGTHSQTALFGPSEGVQWSGLYKASITLETSTGTVLSLAQATFTV